MNGVPQNPRQELISELEGFGYDLVRGVPSDWRESLADGEMRTIIATFHRAFADHGTFVFGAHSTQNRTENGKASRQAGGEHHAR